MVGACLIGRVKMSLLLSLLALVWVGRLAVAGTLGGINIVEPASYKAARLVHDGISQANYTGFYGSTKATCRDVYVPLREGQVKAYRPELFEALRFTAGVSDVAWAACMDPTHLDVLSADSKSGQAFWRSTDGLLVLKTIKPYECRNLRSMLDQLAAHLTAEPSAISSVLGLFRVKVGGRKMYLMACRNAYHADSWHASTCFDLKGSTVGRSKAPSSIVLKDMDLLSEGRRLRLGQARPLLLRTLQRDAQFLSHYGLMDYSLLVDVEHVPRGFLGRLLPGFFYHPHHPRERGGKLILIGTDGNVYHFGIIDFLQQYTFRKWLETLLKGFFWDRRKISCVPPRFYASRFLGFIDENTD
ncbi:hypothetical protein B484DRAFT_445853 [Ochromonadaceae sp. CCMP2298]|nr:hypothetical protein B484DRAFT_445853 [Ochromonadaceae sp. CCMP2298]